MLTINVPIPVTAEEMARQRAESAAAEDKRIREDLSKANRAANRAEPKTGSSMFIATAHGIKARGRSGLVFSPVPSEVKVLDKTDEEIAAMQRSGAHVVNAYGAERLLADTNGANCGLVMFGSRGAADSVLSSSSDAELEAEIAARKSGTRPVRDGTPERITAKAKHDEHEHEKKGR